MHATRRLSWLIGVVFVLSIISTACAGAGDGGPRQPGSYDVQQNSIRFDGDRYALFWADQSGTLHEMQTRKLRLVRDPDKTYLEVPGSGDPVLHLKEDEPISVEGQDRQGGFSSSWFPFFLGTALGSQLGGNRGGTVIINQPAPGERGSYDARTPAYRYPPTGTFGRDEDLHGSLDSSKPEAPDYSRVQPQPYATTGKASGTGGGTAASNKAPSTSSSSGAVGNTQATSGESGGTGGGTAASSKGGFRSGDQSFSNKSSGSSSVGAGSSGALSGGGSSGGVSGKPSSGVSGSKGIGGSGSSGGKGIGGARVGGKR